MTTSGGDARERARDEVRAAFAATATEVPERTCPACGATTRTRFEDCPACGASFFAAPPREARRRRLALWAGVAVVLLAVAVPGTIALLGDKRDRERRERAADTRAVAAERARLTRLQAPHEGAARALRPPAGASPARRLAARAALVGAVERAITRDARARVRTGELDGPIGATECGPILKAPDAVPDDRVLRKAVGRYDCVAVKSDVRQDDRSVGRLGYPFVAALDFARFTYVWCRNTPAQGERGKALVFVRLDRRCLAARGRALGTGYVDVPGG